MIAAVNGVRLIPLFRTKGSNTCHLYMKLKIHLFCSFDLTGADTNRPHLIDNMLTDILGILPMLQKYIQK